MDTARKLSFEAEAIELSWTASAYLDSAIRLCESLIEGGLEDSRYDNRVILHLVFLAAELSFKAGLAAAQVNYPKRHDLRLLRDAFSAAVDVNLELPGFLHEVISDCENHFEEFPAPRPEASFERYRYNSDHAGRAFPRLKMVDLRDLLVELKALKKGALTLFMWIRERPGCSA